MKPSDQALNEARRQRIESIVARHIRDLFRRVPMLTGFWLCPDLEAEASVSICTGCGAGVAVYEEVMRSLVALFEERPEAVQLMRGRTFAREIH